SDRQTTNGDGLSYFPSPAHLKLAASSTLPDPLYLAFRPGLAECREKTSSFGAYGIMISEALAHRDEPHQAVSYAPRPDPDSLRHFPFARSRRRRFDHGTLRKRQEYAALHSRRPRTANIR